MIYDVLWRIDSLGYLVCSYRETVMRKCKIIHVLEHKTNIINEEWEKKHKKMWMYDVHWIIK